MLQKIQIQNYAIIDQLNLEFEAGLNIITGETGAGKSILLGALGLVMGKRADSKVWFDKTKKCVIEVNYNITDLDIGDFFKSYDFDESNPLVIRREITPTGKSRSFINDTPATLKQLQEINQYLVELHQQFDTLEIHNEAFQTQFLDKTTDSWSHYLAYAKSYKTYHSLKIEHQNLISTISKNLQEKSYLEFQINEMEELSLEQGEEVILENQQKQLTHASEIKMALQSNIHSLFNAEPSIISILTDNLRSLEQVSGYSDDIEKVAERLNSSLIELDDIVQELNQIDDKITDDPAQLNQIEERLQLIFSLRQKHNVQSSDELISLMNQFNETLLQFEDFKQQEQKMAIAVEHQFQATLKLGKKLSSTRIKNKTKVENTLVKSLNKLGMPQAQLSFKLTSTEEPGPFGLESINLLFSANKGIALQGIKGIASGGELSRLNLCVKTMIADSAHLPTLIFDEIDTGISGEVAKVMGTMLLDLGLSHQVISITHSPMIAALGQSHYFVAKDHSGDKTTTQITLLSQEGRVIEIAKMLGGDPPSEMSIASAKELLDQNI